MAQDTGSTIQSTGQGAAAGASVGGPWGAVIGAGVGLAGSLLSKKKKTPKAPDYSALTREIDKSTAERRRLAESTRSGLAPINEKFGNDAKDLTSSFLNKTKAAGSEYLDQASNAASLRGKSLIDSLSQSVMEAQPAITQQLRENLAATGGLSRGSANTAFREQATRAGSEIARGATAIKQDELASRQKALDTIFSTNQDALLKATGLDYDTVKALTDMGRDDLIQEAAALAGAEQDRVNAMLGIGQNANTARLAVDSANAANRADRDSALLGAGTNLLTTLLTSRK